MATKNDKLKDLTPSSVTFAPGESPTAEKLQGMMSQVEAGLAYLENIIGDVAGEESSFCTWLSTLARNIGDHSLLNPEVLPNIQIDNYVQTLIPGKVEHELDLLPVGSLSSLIASSSDSCVVPGQYKASPDLLLIPGDWTIASAYIKNGEEIRSRKLITHSPSEGKTIIFTKMTSGDGSSLLGASENVIPSLAQAEFGGPFPIVTLDNLSTRTYKIELPLRLKDYNDLDEISGFSASNTAASAGLNTRYKFPDFFFDSAGLNLGFNDANGLPKAIPLNLIKLYDWDTKKEVSGIIGLKAVVNPATRRYQFMVQMDVGVLLNTTSGKYIVVVAGNSIAQQLKGLTRAVFGNTGSDGRMLRLISHKNLMNLRTGSLLYSNRSKYYGPSNIDNNDHSMYLHRDGFVDSDRGAGGNVLRGNLLIGSSSVGSDDADHEHYNLVSDSFKIAFGKILDGGNLYYSKNKSHIIDFAYGGLTTDFSDSALVITGATGTLDSLKKTVIIDGDLKTKGSVVLGQLNTSPIYLQGKVYVNKELTLIPRDKIEISGEEGKIYYDKKEKNVLVYNGNAFISPWKTSGKAVVIGNGTTTFGKYNGVDYTPFESAVAEVSSTGGTILVLPGDYNIDYRSISLPENVSLEGVEKLTSITSNGSGTIIASGKNIIKNLILIAGSGACVSANGSKIKIESCIFKNSSLGISVGSSASDCYVGADIVFENCSHGFATSELKYNAFKQVKERSLFHYDGFATVDSWALKSDYFNDFMLSPGYGPAQLSFDESGDSAVGRGSISVSGQGRVTTNKFLPVSPKIGIGGAIHVTSIGAISAGVECYDKDYNAIGTEMFIASNVTPTETSLGASFYSSTLKDLPAQTRFVKPILDFAQDAKFDGFEIKNLGYSYRQVWS